MSPPPPTSSWRESTILHVLMFISFLTSGLVVNLVQFLLFLLVVRIGKDVRLFRSLNYYLIYIIYSQLLFLADWWSNATVTYHCDQETLASLGKEHALVLMNHHYELDWLYGWMVGDRAGVLGNCRVYVKKMLKYVPILGWAWTFSDTVFLERNWDKDQDTLRNGLKELQDYPDPMWVLLFPEGTRFTQQKYEAGKQFSLSRGLPVYQHCLVPRSKGFAFTVANLQESRIPWVYDVTLACEGNPQPTLTAALLGHPTKAHMYIRRFRLAEIPKDEDGAAKWLQEVFLTKDALLQNFHSSGSLCTPSLPAYPGVTIAPRPYSLGVIVLVNLCCLGPLAALLVTGGWLSLIILAALFLGATAGIKYFLGLTQIARATSYGNKKE